MASEEMEQNESAGIGSFFSLAGINILIFGGLFIFLLIFAYDKAFDTQADPRLETAGYPGKKDFVDPDANLTETAKAGKKSYATCAACHGAQGEGNVALKAPALAGQEDWYIVSQLKKFKAGTRGAHPDDTEGASMRPMAMVLADDAAMENVAEYAGTFPTPELAHTLEGDAEKGKLAYPVCLACHGPNGEGNKALNAPKLTGLPDWYIVAQLKKFKAGIRGGDPAADPIGATMRPMAMTIPDEEAMKNLAAYIKTLGNPE